VLLAARLQKTGSLDILGKPISPKRAKKPKTIGVLEL
jgi:hypothetical protein